MPNDLDRFTARNVANPDRRTHDASPRWAVVSTYPPTQCGLATFTQSLVTGLTRIGLDVDVVRVVDAQQTPLPGVSHQLVNGAAAADTAAVLNRYDLVMIQHEYGIYGGPDGQDIVAVLGRLTVPVVTVLHTVLAEPTPHQREVLQAVVDASAMLVTMTRTAHDRLVAAYDVDPERVLVIPHGAADKLVSHGRIPGVRRPHRRPYILTWGLLGQGKGIEWGIEALSRLRDLDPRPTYVVAGQTHPRVLEYEGERYRSTLVAKARQLGIADDVVFEDGYLSSARLHTLIQAADVVLLPYDSVEQVTSGVLIEAVAAGRPVVSTGFPHAVELLSGGAGAIVARRDPEAIATALRSVLADPAVAATMTARAGQLAPSLSWSSVARRYREVGQGLCRPRSARPARRRDLPADRLAVVA